MNIDKLKLDKPAPLTNAERQKRWRAKQASRAVAVHFSAHTEATAALLYLRKQWGFTSHQEAIEAALRQQSACGQPQRDRRTRVHAKRASRQESRSRSS